MKHFAEPHKSETGVWLAESSGIHTRLALPDTASSLLLPFSVLQAVFEVDTKAHA